MATDYTANPQGSQSTRSAGYEKRDANPGWIFGLVFFFVILGLTIHLVLAGFLNHLKKKPPPSDSWHPIEHAAHTAPLQTNFPRLRVAPPRDLAEFRAREEAELNSYGWVNKTAGIVRIPIDSAVESPLQKGLPGRTTTT